MIGTVAFVAAALMGWKVAEDRGRITVTHVVVSGILAVILALVLGFLLPVFTPAAFLTTVTASTFDLLLYTVEMVIAGMVTGAASRWLYEKATSM